MFDYGLWNIITITTTVVWGLFLFTLFFIIFQRDWKRN